MFTLLLYPLFPPPKGQKCWVGGKASQDHPNLKCLQALNRKVIFNQVIAGFEPWTSSTGARCLSHLSSPS